MLSQSFDNTWHRIIVWKEQCPNLDIIQKGAQLHVLGRIWRQRYVGADGEERETVEIIANRVKSL